MAFSESLSTKEYYKVSNPPYYNHGFLPSDPEMETIGIFYGSEKKVRFENLKDVLKISCDWLNLDCPIGKTRDE
jgi:hypothetical protein